VAVNVKRGKKFAVATPIWALAATTFCSASATSGRRARSWAGKPGGTVGGDASCSGLAATANEWSGAATEDRERMFQVGAGALHVALLGQRGLELGLGLIQDDRAHEPGPELGGEEADLLRYDTTVSVRIWTWASSERRE
jgi:hypothetical protein